MKKDEYFSCQFLLPNYNNSAHNNIAKAKILVVGAGGLGSTVLTYLIHSGINNIGIVEYDNIDITNIHRQILYNTTDIGKSKIECAINKLTKIKSNTNIINHNYKLEKHNALETFNNYDIILDCTDNIETRLLIDETASKLNIPVIFASVEEYRGMVTILNHKNKIRIKDIFYDIKNTKSPKGILPTVLPIIGGIQATETIKLLTGIGKLLDGKLLHYDTLTMSQEILNIR